MAKRIMVVDDTYEDLEKMQKLLKKKGYEVFAFTNGAAAIDAMEQNGFSLVLLNINLPTLSGYDVSRLIREQFNNTEKICYVSITPKIKAKLENVDGYIQKPFKDEEFISQITKLIEEA